MTFTADIADDFLDLADDLRQVRLRNRRGVVSGQVSALRRAISRREAERSNGRYTASDTVFHLSISQVTTQPELGSKVIDNLSTWTVLDVSRQTLGSRWRCVCRDLAVACGLDQRLTLERATRVKGASGAEALTWTVEARDLIGKAQILAAEGKVEHQNRHQPRTATIWLEDQRLVTVDHRFIGSDGTIYKVLSWEDPDRIDVLFKVLCEVTKWPSP